ncbi:FUSC family protein [Robbsia sp. Bb-Pol-6]|uniref:FUSC family protein n=1 Tax=Robbsia betulipollinis TaxID=2981849 RepID=A0ABT3ZH56_9BURK|nr:FUSC family protein [Robbsia betulipollinis]MCY0385859.1 FUSC family protein [Robbsia betulipollinis]
MKLPGLGALCAAIVKIVRLHGRFVARLLIGAFGSYAIAEYLGLAQSFWSVVTALVVIQASVGGTVNAGIDRLIGTVMGALVGALVGILHPFNIPEGVLLLLAVTPLAFVTAARPAYRIAPITAVIVTLAGTGFHPFWLGAVYRVLEISLGTVVGVAVSLIVLPSHAHRSIRRQCARALGPLADLLEVFLTERGRFRQDRVNLLHDQVRAAIAAAERTALEARREPGGRHLESGIELRALRRIHSDVIFVGRATRDWPDEARWPELDSAVDHLEHTLRRALDGLAQAMSHGGSTGAVREIDGAIARLTAVLDQPPAPLSAKLGVLPFTVQTLQRDISDFADILHIEQSEKAA